MATKYESVDKRKLLQVIAEKLQKGEDPGRLRYALTLYTGDENMVNDAFQTYQNISQSPVEGVSQQAGITVNGQTFKPTTYAEAKAYQETQQKQQELKMSASQDLQTKLSSIDTLLNDKQGLSDAVGINPLGRAPINQFLTGDKQRFIASASQLLNTETLDNLISAKAGGATFGALSEGELNLLRQSATTLNSYAIRDDKGNITGFNASESDVRKALEDMKTRTADALAKANQNLGGQEMNKKQNTPQNGTLNFNSPEEVQSWLQQNPTDPRAPQIQKSFESLGYTVGQSGSKMAQTSHNQAPEQGGFLNDVSKSFTDRTNQIGDVLNSTDSNSSKVLQVTGKELGFVSDVVGSAVVNVLKAVTPDFIEQPVAERVKTLVQAGLDTKVAKDTMAAWDDFKQSNPEMARNIEASGNIANFFALGMGAGEGTKVAANVAGEVATKAGTALEKSGQLGMEAAKTKFAQELVAPVADKATRISQVGRTTETGSGLFRRSVVEPTAAEKRMAELVSGVEGVSPSNTLQQNYTAIQNAISSEADNLITSLSANDFIVSKREVLSRLNTAAGKLKDSPLIVGEAEKMAEKLLMGAKRFVNENAGTGSGLLKARKAYDEWVLKQKPKAFDAKAENAFTVANREVRNAINDLLDAKAPNVGVKDSLRKQSTLLSALDNIAPKAAEEGKTAISRAIQNLGQKLGAKNKFVQTLAASGLALGGGGALVTAPGVVAAGAAGYGVYRGIKALTSPKMRTLLGKALKESGHLLNPEDRQILQDVVDNVGGKAGLFIQSVSDMKARELKNTADQIQERLRNMLKSGMSENHPSYKAGVKTLKQITDQMQKLRIGK